VAAKGFKIADGYVEIHTDYDGRRVAEAIGAELGKADGSIRRTAGARIGESLVHGSEDGIKRRRGRIAGLGRSIVSGIFSPNFPKIFARGLLEGVSVGFANAQGFGALASNPYAATIGLALGGTILTALASGLSAGILGTLAGAFSLGLLGLAAFILKGNPQIRNAGKALGNDFMQEFRRATAPLVIPVLQALRILNETLLLNHQLWSQLFEPLVPVIPALALGLSGFVTNLTPGLTALSALGANVLLDLAGWLPKLGTSMSNFFLSMRDNWPALHDSFLQFSSDLGTIFGWIFRLMLFLAVHYGTIRAFTLGFLQAVLFPVTTLIFFIKLVAGWINSFINWLNKAKRETGSWGGVMKLIVFNMATSFLATLLGLVLGAARLFGSLFSGTRRMFGLVRNAAIFAIVAMYGATIAKVAGLVSGVLRYFASMPSSVARSMSALKNVVVGTFSLAGNWLYSAGSRIIGGLIDGVRSKIGEFRSYLSSLTNMIPSWKGPAAVDARLLEPNGRMIMDGLMRGIAGRLPALQMQLAGVTGAVPTMAGAPMPTASTITTTHGPTINLTVHAGIGTDGSAIGRVAARAIKLAITDYDRSVKR
jgi:hypothetical protein